MYSRSKINQDQFFSKRFHVALCSCPSFWVASPFPSSLSTVLWDSSSTRRQAAKKFFLGNQAALFSQENRMFFCTVVVSDGQSCIFDLYSSMSQNCLDTKRRMIRMILWEWKSGLVYLCHQIIFFGTRDYPSVSETCCSAINAPGGCWLAGINRLNTFQCVLRNKPNRNVVILVPFQKRFSLEEY